MKKTVIEEATSSIRTDGRLEVPTSWMGHGPGLRSENLDDGHTPARRANQIETPPVSRRNIHNFLNGWSDIQRRTDT